MAGVSVIIHGTEYLYGITHNSKFHSDDVFSAALLNILARHQNPCIANPEFLITRQNMENAKRIAFTDDSTVLVFDIANTRYDHHMEPRETRSNGIAYAAFGKLWRDVHTELGFSSICASIFDRDFVQFIDNHDNHGVLNPLSLTISAMNTEDYKNDDIQAEAFHRAVDYAIMTLRPLLFDLRRRDNGIYSILTKGTTITRDQDNISAVLYQDAMRPDWVSDVRHEHAIIYPHGRGGWAIEALRSHVNNTTESYNRILAPKEYRGKPESDLRSLWKSMRFCHASGFLTTFDTEMDAINFFKAANWEVL